MKSPTSTRTVSAAIITKATKPVLYSFRRCPYAIRARMALCHARINFELIEVDLKNKPERLLKISPKGTVPVLHIQLDEKKLEKENGGLILDESWEIMQWALKQKQENRCDPENWLEEFSTEHEGLLQKNDGEFKSWLDKYKYADRHPEHSAEYYREQAELFLSELNQRLQQQSYLFSSKLSVIDVAIFPFVRQFAGVDKQWFEQSPYSDLKQWLDGFLQSDLFQQVMVKPV